MLLFRNMMGFSTWAKFYGHIYTVIMQKYLLFIMHYEVRCCLHVKLTCEHISAHLAINVYMFMKFHIHNVPGCSRY